MRILNPNNRSTQGVARKLLILAAITAPSIGLAESGAIDFDTQIVPILSKAGCNAAACHGGAAGRGGFRLSLFGGDPAFDHRSMVRELEGRRINYRTAADSLIVTKPTEMLEHGGGQPLEPDGDWAGTLISWIEQGAERKPLRRLIRINVAPSAPRFDQLPAQFTLQVEAEFADGTRRDVSQLARYATNDKASVKVNEIGVVQVLRPGRHAVIVSFCDEIVPVIVTAPFAPPLIAGDLDKHNWVDESINETLASLGLSPAGLIDDRAFARRVRLDLTGRLPTPAQLREFVADERTDKRANLIDALLDSDEFVEFWTYRLARLLRVQPPGNDLRAAEVFRAWIQESLRTQFPWNSMVSQMLTATGDTHEIGPANMHRLSTNAREQAEYVSEVFMGVTMRCANCHNHPLDRWRQDDYHGLAQLFARIQRGRQVAWGKRGEVTHPKTRLPAVPRIPDGEPVKQLQQGRRQLATWLTHEDNAYFAKAMVNRLWKAMMGRGLVEPVTDLRITNPPTHPRLLERLADSFRDSGYRLQPLLRQIANSRTYQRHCRQQLTDPLVPDDRFYAHAPAKRLDAEVLADAISDVLEIPGSYEGYPAGTRAIALVDPATPSIELDALGRCTAPMGCDIASAPSSAGIATQLGLLNGFALNGRLKATTGLLSRLMTSTEDAEVVQAFYLRALSRPPAEDELAWWASVLVATGRKQRRECLEDFVWSLLTSEEFAFVN